MTLSGYERLTHSLCYESSVFADAFIIDRIMHKCALALAFDQPGLAQNTQVLGDSRLGNAKLFGQGAHA